MTDVGTPGAAGTVGEAGEPRVIALVRSLVPAPPPWVTVGIGDDAAVLEGERNRLEVITTDVLIEGVHFDRAYCDPASIGYKALAVNLSDLAAMGAAPRAALLSLGLPAALPFADLEIMLRALVDLATAHKVTLVGGNVARSPGPLFLDVTLTGTVKRRRVLTRSGGRPGDALYVTGSLGAAAAGLLWLRRRSERSGTEAEAAAGAGTGARPDAGTGAGTGAGTDAGTGAETGAGAAAGSRADADRTDAVSGAVGRFLRPEPRVRVGLLAGRTRAASACMDLSDGLADAVRQMAQASGTGALVEAEALPIHPGATGILRAESRDPVEAALSGGEDYELLLAVPRRSLRRFLAVQRLSGLPATRVGVLTPGTDLVLRRNGQDTALPTGFRHFT